MRPYYEHAGITIYHGDCREVLPTIAFDGVLTDSPYPEYEYPWAFVPLESVVKPQQRGFYFWPANVAFPLPFTAIHVWSKCNVLVGGVEPYENIYEVGGSGFCGVFRYGVINCTMNAQMNGDIYWPHPTQKPIRLMRQLLKRLDGMVVDPFMGIGTTLRAAKDLGRHAVGIEIEERYCEIAAKRLAQEVLDFSPA